MKKLVPLVLAGSIVSAGCSYSRPHTSSEKWWFGGLFGCSVLDIITTDKVLNEGGHEMNPIYGRKNPSNEQLILAKSIAIGALYLGGQEYPEKRETLYQIGTGVYCTAAAWNYSQMKEKKIETGFSVKF